MSEQTSKEKPYYGGDKAFATAEEAARYCKANGFKWMGGPGWDRTADSWLGGFLKKTREKILRGDKHAA